MKRRLQLLSPIAAGLLAVGCVPDEKAPVRDTSDAAEDVAVTDDVATPDDTGVAEDSSPPEDTTVPPEDTTLPPEDTTLPPEDTTLPPEDTTEVETPDGKIWLNEIVASRLDDGDDWIELKNGAATLAIDIGGWTVEDSGAAPYTIPDGTTLAPGARLVLTQTDFAFGLGSADSVTLRDADGTEIDTISWEAGAAPAGWSFGRLPDADGDKGAWQTLREPTNAAENATFEPSVVINEVVAADIDGGDDWIELTNLGESDASLAGWTLRDDGANTYVIPADTTLGTGLAGWWVIEQTTFAFGLGKADGVWLIAPDGLVHDVTAWADGENVAGQSRSRLPDGTGSFATSNEPTKGESNLP